MMAEIRLYKYVAGIPAKMIGRTGKMGEGTQIRLRHSGRHPGSRPELPQDPRPDPDPSPVSYEALRFRAGKSGRSLAVYIREAAHGHRDMVDLVGDQVAVAVVFDQQRPAQPVDKCPASPIRIATAI